MKCCTKCKEEKEQTEFSFRKDRNVYASECKKCIAKRSNDHYKANRDEQNRKRKKYYLENRQIQLEKRKKFYWDNREDIRKRVNASRKTPEQRSIINARGRKWAKENKEKHQANATKWKRNNPEKAKAHQYVLWAVRLDVLKKPEVCANCKMKVRLDAHHQDYSKPLEVEWLCRLCHMHQHEKMLDIKPEGDYVNISSRFNISGNSKESKEINC